MRTKKQIKKDFIGLSCRLSPENLCCDGEISQTEVDRRYNQIMREWRKLEKEFGRAVGDAEVFGWMTADLGIEVKA